MQPTRIRPRRGQASRVADGLQRAVVLYGWLYVTWRDFGGVVQAPPGVAFWSFYSVTMVWGAGETGGRIVHRCVS